MSRFVPAPNFQRDSFRFLVLAWVFIVAGAIVLVFGYGSIPDAVVIYRVPWAKATTMSPKSIVSVGRVVAMGVGQVGAATAMLFATRGTGPWERFWRWLALVAGAKTLLECGGFLVRQGSMSERALTFATIGVVGLYALSAARWWRRGELRSHPPVVGLPRLGLAASLALWVVFMVAPHVLA